MELKFHIKLQFSGLVNIYHIQITFYTFVLYINDCGMFINTQSVFSLVHHVKLFCLTGILSAFCYIMATQCSCDGSAYFRGKTNIIHFWTIHGTTCLTYTNPIVGCKVDV